MTVFKAVAEHIVRLTYRGECIIFRGYDFHVFSPPRSKCGVFPAVRNGVYRSLANIGQDGNRVAITVDLFSIVGADDDDEILVFP